MLFSFLLQKISLTTTTTQTRRSFSTIKKPTFKLNAEQRNIIKAISNKKSVFITGPGGTGKSFLLKKAIHRLKTKIYKPYEVSVTASTGVAACALNGQTLDSFAGIVDNRDDDKDAFLKRVCDNPRAVGRWRRVKALVIDEVSMVSGELFDILEYVARNVKGVDEPWGGIQMIVSGDFFQLPPVGDKEFAFEADCWESSFDWQVELTQNFRQSGDLQYTELLQSIRKGIVSEHHLEILRQRQRCHKRIKTSVTVPNLFPIKKDAERVNDEELRKLKEDKNIGIVETYTAEDTYPAEDTGVEPWKSQLEKGIAPKELQLCKGARVMLIKNIDLKNGLVNGAVGTVIEFRLDKKACKIASKGFLPIVKFDSGIKIRIKPEKWEVIEDDRTASRRQIPLILAWATSIHKTQGMTLDLLHADLSKAFGCGMVYVALSRVRSQDGLYLSGFDHSKIKAHPKVLEFYDNLSRRCDRYKPHPIIKKKKRYDHHREILQQRCNKQIEKFETVPNLYPRKEVNAFWHEVDDAKYGASNMVFQPKQVSQPHDLTSFWKSIVSFFDGIRFVVGRGNPLRFWLDNWRGPIHFCKRFPSILPHEVLKEELLCSHFNNDSGTWNLHVQRRHPRGKEATKLFFFKNLLANKTLDDIDSWGNKSSHNGAFLVEVFYQQLFSTQVQGQNLYLPFPSNLVWRSHITLATEFYWYVLWEPILTLDKLRECGMITPNRCALCESNDESIPHPFLICSISLPLWTSLLGTNHRILEVIRPVDNMRHFFTSWPRPSSGDIPFFLCKLLPFAVSRVLWCHRNDRIFKEQTVSVTRMKFLVKELIWSCLLIDRCERRFRQDWTYRAYCIPGFVGFYYATTINNSTLVFLMYFEKQSSLDSAPYLSRLGLSPSITKSVLLGDDVFYEDRPHFLVCFSKPVALVADPNDILPTYHGTSGMNAWFDIVGVMGSATSWGRRTHHLSAIFQ